MGDMVGSVLKSIQESVDRVIEFNQSVDVDSVKKSIKKVLKSLGREDCVTVEGDKIRLKEMDIVSVVPYLADIESGKEYELFYDSEVMHAKISYDIVDGLCRSMVIRPIKPANFIDMTIDIGGLERIKC